MNRERVLITAALPYANGPLHFGHIAGAYLPADCYARFERLLGNETLFICGSDEHGVAITMSAELAGRTPKEQVDLFHELNKTIFKKINIFFDHYSRTTSKEHALLSQEFFLSLDRQGYLEEKETEQLYSETEERFLADRYVMGTCPKCGFDEARGDECPKCGGNYEATDLKNPLSKMTKSKLVLKKTTHWFLRCDLFKERLFNWLETKNWKPTVLNFIKPYIEELRPRAITRDGNWGIPVPLEKAKGKVLYVWFDAPIGYISATKEWAIERGNPEEWKSFWCDPRTHFVQFIGKDNIPFHAIFFPAMLMGHEMTYNLVDELPANEFLQLEGKQFSKSDGWYIDLNDFLDRFPVDTIRYTLAANAPESQDSDFTWKDFQTRVNSELVGKLGNFIHRTLSFISNFVDQKIPTPTVYDEIDNAFLESITSCAIQAKECYRSFHLRKASATIMELAALGNVYFDQKKPWKLIKEKENNQALHAALYCSLTAIKTLALIASPIMPESAEKIWQMLGFEGTLALKQWDALLTEELTPGKPLPKPEIVFTKIEDEVIAAEVDKLKALHQK